MTSSCRLMPWNWMVLRRELLLTAAVLECVRAQTPRWTGFGLTGLQRRTFGSCWCEIYLQAKHTSSHPPNSVRALKFSNSLVKYILTVFNISKYLGNEKLSASLSLPSRNCHYGYVIIPRPFLSWITEKIMSCGVCLLP